MILCEDHFGKHNNFMLMFSGQYFTRDYVARELPLNKLLFNLPNVYGQYADYAHKWLTTGHRSNGSSCRVGGQTDKQTNGTVGNIYRLVKKGWRSQYFPCLEFSRRFPIWEILCHLLLGAEALKLWYKIEKKHTGWVHEACNILREVVTLSHRKTTRPCYRMASFQGWHPFKTMAII